MAKYKILNEITDFSALHQDEINSLLKSIIGKKDSIYCLCNKGKPPMHVSHRDGNYFPVRDSNTGDMHYKLCRHHKLKQEEIATMGYDMEALSSTDEEELLISLSKSLKKKVEAQPANKTEYHFRNMITREITNRITELGLLHLLWERAGLHEFLGTRSDNIWGKIRHAANGIRPRGINGLQFGLSDILLLPLHSETPNQKDRNQAKFKEAQRKNRFLLFIATLNHDEANALINANNKDFSLTKNSV
ncbi:DUF1173 family protein [Trinickia dinghuensis]|uniref:DUF1173 family protein n=1 Tax=Trinickia dinghuensis TaxID=2291023 RepID=A0A3D8K1Y7_9BURK|nr:DUF1173 family protein [Trinickia dinghuensis]RDU98916.1 DUF1173 family protein [Trinickia dinghuensis]